MGYVNDCLPKPGNYLGYCRALYQIPSQAAESFTQGQRQRVLGTGADSAATESAATRAGELERRTSRIRPSNCGGEIVVRYIETRHQTRGNGA